MKQILFCLLMATITLTSCQDYNEENFPELDAMVNKSSAVTYSYTLVDGDYSTISSLATTAAVTTNEKSRAKAVGTNKFFMDTIPAATYVPYLLNKKYVAADKGALAAVTYKFSRTLDVKTVLPADTFSLATADYDAMGTALNQPGKYDNFSSTILPDYYIPIFLKGKFIYAQKNDVKLVTYKYFANSVTANKSTAYQFDGTNWVNYASPVLKTEKFSYADRTWSLNVDPSFTAPLTSNLGEFTSTPVVGSYNFVATAIYGAKISAYSGGAQNNAETWLTSGNLNFSKVASAKLSFSHAINYVEPGKITEKHTLWITADYTGNPSTTTWTAITIPTYPTGSDWVYADNTDLAIPAEMIGKPNVRIAFKYLGSTVKSSTWEIRNVVLTATMQ